MIGLVAALLVANVVLLPPPQTLGVDDDARAHLVAALSRGVLEASASPPLVSAPLSEGCADDEACRKAALASAGADALLVVEVAQIGAVIEVRERLFDREAGTVVDDRRRVDPASYASAPLSPALVLALTKQAAPPALPPDSPTAQASSPSLAVVGVAAGAVIAAVGVTAAGVAAATLEDAARPGADKEAAYAYGWAGLVAAALGIGVAGASAVFALGVAP